MLHKVIVNLFGDPCIIIGINLLTLFIESKTFIDFRYLK